MFGTASRAVLRSPAPRLLLRRQPARRFISFAPPSQKSRSWKSSALRWGVAIGGLYFYNTSNLFAEEEPITYSASYLNESDQELPTLEILAASRKQRLAASPQPLSLSPSSKTPRPTSSNMEAAAPVSSAPELDPNSPEALEEEAEGEGAFNPETGEINWDCPCLGGMAYGPCGPHFREAFSCFVYSTVEPKGMDCIENFKKMQDCFRAHPDVYGSELADEDDGEFDEENETGPPMATKAPESNSSTPESAPPPRPSPPEPTTAPTAEPTKDDYSAPIPSKAQKSKPKPRPTQPQSEPSETPSKEEVTGSQVPKAWNDAR